MARKIASPQPGPHIRDNLIPKGMSVTEAAALLDVGRPALSNLLNGNASLSAEMAARVERAFGANARDLMDMQAAYDAQLAKKKGAAASTKAYVPPFLQFKANDIEGWASSISARSRFAVFLRTLVNSTGLKLEKVEFPGNDDAERPGWDGFIEAGEGTPWIPSGKSGWEFGVNKGPKQKADSDYAKSITQVSDPAERAEITFVFVTPMRWPGKSAWEQARRAEGNWKNIRVFDASNLEEWLEQSIPGQAWLANELEHPSQGVLSLDECWGRWASNCEPPLAECLFASAVESAKRSIAAKLNKTRVEPVAVAADSTGEALAFLHCLFSPNDPDLSVYRDRVAVFTEQGALSRLASKSPHFIAVVPIRAVEKELAQYAERLRSIVIYPRNGANTDSDIVLEPLSHDAFEKALRAMDCSRDQIQRLDRESGRSLTVLRRRLSKLEATRTPDWAADSEVATSLIPFLFAGSWKESNEADRVILSLLGNETPYPALESRLTTLLQLEDAPVWSVGSFRGLVSKIDVLFAINKNIVRDQIECFLSVSKLVLSEEDPSLDLPEEERWTAGMYGKTREVSGALRDGISETLVLLSVYGNALMNERLGVDLEVEVDRLIQSLLTPLTVRSLESQSGDLPMYAEAAPTVFLDLFERDLDSATPQALGLMRPANTGIFGSCPRTGLLWALENLAWSPEYLTRTVLILARLAETQIDDNWANKPSASLSAIFRCWMPQTAAPVATRIAILEMLVEKFPKVAWPICIEQFDGLSHVGSYSHKPRWRTDGYGYGEPARNGEDYQFALRALEITLAWKAHDRETLGDLVGCVVGLDEGHREAIWNLVECWGEEASDEDKAWLREKIRVSAFTRRALKRGQIIGAGTEHLDRARRTYDALIPSDLLMKHEWLFRKQWVEWSAEELAEEELDHQKRDEWISTQRKSALEDILSERGMQGVLSLAEIGEAAGIAGWYLPRLLENIDQIVDAIRYILDCGPLAESHSRRILVLRLLHALPSEQEPAVLQKLIPRLYPSELVAVLIICPFGGTTWELLNSLGQNIQAAYWNEVQPGWPPQEGEEIQFSVERLLEADRPRAAFQLVHFELNKLQPKLLYRLMLAMASSTTEAPVAYQLDSHHVKEAFSLLNKSSEIAVGLMAGLEFQYIDVFSRSEGSIPNLEKQIEEHPELFVQAIVFAYKRSDEGRDPEEFQLSDPKQVENRALAAYKLLERLSRIPGRDREGTLTPGRIESWVARVRSACKELAREKVCDLSLGKLFSTAPIGEDGVWPCEPVRDALEKIATDSISDGITTGLYNLRGVHLRGEGGGQERELAQKYEGWARALEFTHPRVSVILTKMVRSYQREASWEDTAAGVRRRLRH